MGPPNEAGTADKDPVAAAAAGRVETWADEEIVPFAKEESLEAVAAAGQDNT